MTDLKNSVTFLFLYVLIVFGIAQINFVEDNIINFNPAFFILMALAVVSGIIVKPSPRFSIYVFLSIWVVVYLLTWLLYWRDINPAPLQLLAIQFLLIEIAAGLAFDVGRHISQVTNLLEGLTASTFPNRTLELRAAEGRIGAELTRSRRYHHSLAVLLVEMDELGQERLKENVALSKDILSHFAVAKIGQIINECARETDLIIRDDKGRFVVLCPETNHQSSLLLAERIEQAVFDKMGTKVLFGSSSFPDEALTFDNLVQKASEKMKDAPEPQGIMVSKEAETRETVSEKSAL